MREFTTAKNDRRFVEGQLRADEELLESGGVDDYDFYTAFNDEDFCRTKESKLNKRRENRKTKRKAGYYND